MPHAHGTRSQSVLSSLHSETTDLVPTELGAASARRPTRHGSQRPDSNPRPHVSSKTSTAYGSGLVAVTSPGRALNQNDLNVDENLSTVVEAYEELVNVRNPHLSSPLTTGATQTHGAPASRGGKHTTLNGATTTTTDPKTPGTKVKKPSGIPTVTTSRPTLGMTNAVIPSIETPASTQGIHDKSHQTGGTTTSGSSVTGGTTAIGSRPRSTINNLDGPAESAPLQPPARGLDPRFVIKAKPDHFTGRARASGRHENTTFGDESSVARGAEPSHPGHWSNIMSYNRATFLQQFDAFVNIFAQDCIRRHERQPWINFPLILMVDLWRLFSIVYEVWGPLFFWRLPYCLTLYCLQTALENPLLAVVLFLAAFLLPLLGRSFTSTGLAKWSHSPARNSLDTSQFTSKEHEYGLRYKLGQFMPHWITHPLDYLKADDILDLQKRMSSVENDVYYLKSRTTLDHKTLAHLEGILPDALLLKKDADGQPVIPADFWTAMRHRLAKEPFAPANLWPTLEDGNNQPTITDTKVAKVAQGVYSHFLDENEAKIKAWQGETFDEMWSSHVQAALRNEVLVSREDMLDLIQKTFESSRKDVKHELARIGKLVQQTMHRVQTTNETSVHETSLLDTKQMQLMSESTFRRLMPKHLGSRDEIRKACMEVFQQLVPAATLEALANVQLIRGIEASTRCVNYFAPGVGAVINPKLTSDTYQFAKDRANLVTRKLLSTIGYPFPRANPPASALTRWSEQGDCWCSKPVNSGGIQLGVLVAKPIYPDEIIIEHLAASASTNPLNAPRRIEVFAAIDSSNWDQWSAVNALSEQLFPDAAPEEILDERFVRIARFEYDRTSDFNVQAFQVSINLQQFGMPTTHVVVRALSTWGEPYGCFYRVRLHGVAAV